MKLNVPFALSLGISCAQSFSISTQGTWKSRISTSRSGLNLLKLSAVATKTTKRERRRRTVLPESASHEKFQDDSSAIIQLSAEGSTHASKEAEKILFKLEGDGDDVLNAVHYASVIDSWANGGNSQRALSVLNHMIIRYNEAAETPSEAIIPNAHCFSSAMKALKRSSKNGSLVSTKCEEFLAQMIEFYVASGQEEAKPNTVVYNNLLNTYAEDVTTLFLKRKMDDRKNLYPSVLKKQKQDNEPLMKLVEKAIALIRNMESDSDVPKPDLYSYCTIISILAKCEDLEMARLGEGYLRKISKKHDTPTYNALISAVSTHGSVGIAM